MFAVLSALATALLHAPLAPTAAPPNQPAQAIEKPVMSLDACRIAAPDAEATLIPYEASASVSSSGVAYSSSFRRCRRFVGELHVPPDAKGPQGGMSRSTPYYTIRPGLIQSPTESTCAATTLTMDAYLEAAGSSGFVLHSQSEYVGVLDAAGFAPRCVLTLVEGSTPAPQREPNSAGSETWRVLVTARRGNLRLPVTARAIFDAIPN